MSHSCHRYLFYIKTKVRVCRLKKSSKIRFHHLLEWTGARKKFWGQIFSEIQSFLSAFSPKICTWEVAKPDIWLDKYTEMTLIRASREVYLDLKVMPYDFLHYENFSVNFFLFFSKWINFENFGIFSIPKHISHQGNQKSSIYFDNLIKIYEIVKPNFSENAFEVQIFYKPL